MSDPALGFAYLAGALVIVVSALAARRASARLLLRSLLAWLAIGAVVWLLVANRNQIIGSATRFAANLGFASPARSLAVAEPGHRREGDGSSESTANSR